MEVRIRHLTREQLEAGLDAIRTAPKNEGTLDLIVRRPAISAREVLDTGELDLRTGLVGDNLSVRGSSRTESPRPSQTPFDPSLTTGPV